MLLTYINKYNKYKQYKKQYEELILNQNQFRKDLVKYIQDYVIQDKEKDYINFYRDVLQAIKDNAFNKELSEKYQYIINHMRDYKLVNFGYISSNVNNQTQDIELVHILVDYIQQNKNWNCFSSQSFYQLHKLKIRRIIATNDEGQLHVIFYKNQMIFFDFREQQLFTYHSQELLVDFIHHIYRKSNLLRQIRINNDLLLHYYQYDASGQQPNMQFFNTNICIRDLILQNQQKQILQQQLNQFFKNQKYYKKFHLKHQLGILLYGNPGNGKTSIIKSIAHDYKINVHTVHLSNDMSIDTFNKIFDNILYRQQDDFIIISFEDIDCMECCQTRELREMQQQIDKYKLINQQKLSPQIQQPQQGQQGQGQQGQGQGQGQEQQSGMQQKKQNLMTLDVILNKFDGLIELSKIILVITTNHIEKLDPALIRAGRMDIKLELKNTDLDQAKQIAHKFFKCQFDYSKFIEYKYSMSESIQAAKIGKEYFQKFLYNETDEQKQDDERKVLLEEYKKQLLQQKDDEKQFMKELTQSQAQ